jgi:carbamoyl-phosphate synthase large subunit
VELLFKVAEGRPNVLDLLKNNEIALVINTPKTQATARADEIVIRTTAHYSKVPVMTTIAAAKATVQGIRSTLKGGLKVKALQDYHK